MKTDSFDLIDPSELYFFVGEDEPNKSDILRSRKLGAKLLRLSPSRLVELFEVWEICHREIGSEPFVVNLVRNEANLDTLSDLKIDFAEQSLEQGHNQYGLDLADLMEIIEVETMKQELSLEQSADSIPALDLARFVLSVTVVHPPKDVSLYSEREFYLSGDLEDPKFLEELSSRYIEWEYEKFNSKDLLEVSIDELVESEDSDKDFTLMTLSENSKTFKNTKYGKVVKLTDVEIFFEYKYEEAIKIITSLHASRQLEREAEEFGFKLVQRTG